MKIKSKDDADSVLPTKKVSAKPDPMKLVYLFIGPPKFGKTTWFCNIPEALLLAFERGHAFQSAFKIAVNSWKGKEEIEEDEDGVRYMSMEMVMHALEHSEKFPFIIFDTADMAAKLCSDYYCKVNGWDHISSGGDFGKGYDIGQNTPFRQYVGRILATGRGIGFITHSQVSTAKFKTGDKVKKETSLPGGIHKFLHTQADVILHGMFGNTTKGKYKARILQTAGDDETLAGNRMREIVLPKQFVIDNEDPWKQWLDFFKNPKAAALAEKEAESLSLKSKSHKDEPATE